MALPRGDEYNQAIQNPKICFTDSDLKSCQVEQNSMGLPKPYSGGFTTTYQLYNSQNKFAVRCFTREIKDLGKRYQEISRFLKSNSCSYFVDAQYLEQGIKVNGKFYPIIKMKWLEGEPLNLYLDKNISNTQIIRTLLNEFLKLIETLGNYRISHGDLQHGNIIVKDNKLYLIDYDGIYFPSLKGLMSNEIGHPNFQHPQRNAQHYSEKNDYFASIVIYTALKALSIKPELWHKYNNDENLLFKNTDFVNPINSSIFQELSTIQGLEKAVTGIRNACFLDFDEIPSLHEFLSGNYKQADVNKILLPPERTSAYTQLDASDVERLRKFCNKKVEIIGQTNNLFQSKDRNGDDYAFLNFGKHPNQTLQLTFWPRQSMNAIIKLGIDLKKYENKWVKVIGIPYLSQPSKDGKVYVNLDIDRIGQIEIIDFDIAEPILQQILSEKHKRMLAQTEKKNTATTNLQQQNKPTSNNWWEQKGLLD